MRKLYKCKKVPGLSAIYPDRYHSAFTLDVYMTNGIHLPQRAFDYFEESSFILETLYKLPFSLCRLI